MHRVASLRMPTGFTTARASDQVAASLGDGRTWSADALLPAVYEELRRLAHSHLAQLGPGQTLQATALVHEAWIRMTGPADPGWECRAHFYGAASRAMRHILVDQSRRKARLKHGGTWKRRSSLEPGAYAELGEPDLHDPAQADELLALDGALERLERVNPLGAQIVLLRFFAGLGVDEVARSLGLSTRRVERLWRFARCWLQKEMERD